MNKSHWILVACVATMVCNGSCRPREVDIKNIYPVYRSEKQLELESPNRYGKQYKEKQDGDSVSYHRIDIPYKNGFRTAGKLKNNSKTVMDYVPVALTIKRPNIKIWPSDQNGIESPDDLSLYNIYTNNVNPLNQNHATTPGYDLPFHYTSHKPSILILEELTTKKPFYSVHTVPIQVVDRPPPSHPSSFPPPEYPETPAYRPTEPPSTEQFTIYPTTETPPPTETPIPETPTYATVQTTTRRPETTTKKRKKNKCPNVSITATSIINNSNTIKKEGCQDISIHINTDVSNSNSGFMVPGRPGNTVVVVTSRPTNGKPSNPVVVMPSQPTTTTGVGFGVLDAIWAIVNRIFSFSFLNPISGGTSSPLSALFTSLSAIFLPWIFPHLLFHGIRRRKRVVRRDESAPRYSARFSDFHRGRAIRDRDWGPLKKISSSPLPTAETEVQSEKANKTNVKFDIESIATVARASNDGPPLPSPTALGHMLDTVSQLVESDIRTPPKLKEIIKEKANEHKKEAPAENSTPLPYTFIYDDDIGKFEEKHEATDTSLLLDSSEGKASNAKVKVSTDEGVKGIAIPVVMDDDYELTPPPKKLQKIPEVPKPTKEDKKKTAVTKTQPTTTPSSGLSTWILLSDNKDVTTPSPKKNNGNKKEDDKKKAVVTTTTKKPTKTQTTTQKSVTQANKKVTAKPTSKKPETETPGMSALEALVKNQKKGSTTTSKPKVTETKKKVTDRIEVAETKDKIEIELIDSKIHTLPPHLPITMDDKSVTVSTSSSSQPTTETSVEGTTKKKSSTKKKKKNKNRKKKPSDDTGIEAKIPSQAVGSQIYNFLSREIVPTVGLGLIGVALTAGLASFLGYNPFGSSTIPLRRTYDTHHGYTPNYYNYNTDYGDGGQSEEVLFREVLSGMPEDSRYGLTHSDTTYPEAYNRPEQMYDNVKNPTYPTGTMYNSEKDIGSYDTAYPQDYSTGYGANYDSQDKKYPDVKEKYPVYTRETGTSFVYPETTGMTSAEKASRISEDYQTQNTSGDKYGKSNPDTIERQPEALYRVASESEIQYRNKESTIQGINSQTSWHRIGSPMEAKKQYPTIEPGPRSLDLSKEPKKRSKRAAESVIQRISPRRTKKANDVENEIDFEDSFNDSKFSEQNEFSTSTAATKTTTVYTEATTVTTTTNATPIPDDVKDGSSTEIYEGDNDSTAPPPSSVSVLDVLKRLAQFKLRLGLNFLRSTTDIFSRYLDDIQRRVDESFANTTTTTVQYNKRKNPWSRLFFPRLNDDDDEDESYRRKRSVLEENQFLGAMLTEEDSTGRFSKSTKKDLRLSNKIFHQKKNSPKKFEAKRTK